ncbi:Beta-galactosidase [Patulibacter medicamentivorans]|uniref:Beta-galactosidase n=1 Tax=Patulibacter medicamentivorans TaxID=1097667 RepID=H0E746_9ACTN|nr:glycoside hydrolase family 2 TIM barrel-domain containing protein [Patulibacter medicamentivorans]EHN10491.1 Beta-galactosidase [Patulibacter medicamentivorans]
MPQNVRLVQNLRPRLLVLTLLAGVAATAIAPGPLRAADPPAAGTPGVPMTLGGPFGRIALDTDWTVASDPNDGGLASGWQKGGFDGNVVTVPYVPNADRITGAAGVLSHRGSIAWYRRTVQVDQTGAYAIAFGSVNHKATVWVDGRKVASHTGEFLPFEARTQLTAGRQHTIVVRADWRDPEKMKNQGWHRAWFNFGGINREVTLRRLGASEVKAPYVVTRLQSNGSAKVTVSAAITNRSVTRGIQLSGVLRREGQEVKLDFPKTTVPRSGTRRASVTVTIDDPALWAPGSPNLYDLTLGVAGESAYQTRTGLRQMSQRRGQLYLNGKRIQLRGASIHEDAPGYGTGLHAPQMDSLIDDLKAIGANATRAQHPLAPALLERLDAAGIMVWQGIGPVDSPGSWTNRSAAQQRNIRERVQTTLDEQQTHPSTIVWNLVNEIAKNGNSHGQIPYIRETSRKLKRLDPDRLVALDVWGTPRKLCRPNTLGIVALGVWQTKPKSCRQPNGQPGREVWDSRLPQRMGPVYQYVDAIGITNYEGWYSEPGAPMPYLARRIKAYTDKATKIYAGKAIVVTEFGAEANGENSTSRPGGYDYQANLIKTTIAAYAANPKIQGTLIWNLRDFGVAPTFLGGSIRNVYKGPLRLVRGLNQKGLFTYDGNPKPSVAVTKAALAAAGERAGH